MVKESISMMKEIGERVASEREKQDLSQQKLAILANVSRQTIRNAEEGSKEIRTDTLIKIAVALEVPLSCLQPSELDGFSDYPRECSTMIKKLNGLQPAKRHDVIRVLESVIDSMTN